MKGDCDELKNANENKKSSRNRNFRNKRNIKVNDKNFILKVECKYDYMESQKDISA